MRRSIIGKARGDREGLRKNACHWGDRWYSDVTWERNNGGDRLGFVRKKINLKLQCLRTCPESARKKSEGPSKACGGLLKEVNLGTEGYRRGIDEIPCSKFEKPEGNFLHYS